MASFYAVALITCIFLCGTIHTTDASFQTVAEKYLSVQTSLVTVTEWATLFHTKVAAIKSRPVCSDLCEVRADCAMWTITATDCILGGTEVVASPVATTTELQSVTNVPGEVYHVFSWRLFETVT